MTTTAEFIKMIQQEDPEGTAEVCVGTAPVWFVERVPAYYDGRLEFVEQRPQAEVSALVVHGPPRMWVSNLGSIVADMQWTMVAHS